MNKTITTMRWGLLAGMGLLAPGGVLLADSAGTAGGDAEAVLAEGFGIHGIDIQATLTADWSVSLHGGLNTNGSALRHLLDVAVTIDTRALMGHAGGAVGMLFQQQHGADGSGEDVGDIQVYSNIDADGRTQLAELWYEQDLPDHDLRLIVGKIDANGLFAFVDHGGEFVHSSPGWSPTILGFPSYPDPAMSVNMFYEPDADFYLGVGVYDGALQEGVLTGKRGPSTFFGEPGDLFVIGEAGVRWLIDDRLAGRLGVGGWHHTGTFDRFAGGTQGGAEGVYFVLDQTVWDVGGGRGVDLFGQYGYTPKDVSAIEHHVGAGAVFRGMVPGRQQDLIGLMGSLAHLSDEPGAGFGEHEELAIELFYKAQVTERFSLKPDLQYIMHPGGDQAVGDALVFTLRGELAY